jgi:hypothetical protein
MDMSEYHKIQTLFKRDMSSKRKTLLEGDWTLPEFGGDFEAEGIVARRKVELFTRAGQRLIAKLECRDFVA